MRWVLCLMILAALGFAPAPVYKPNKDDADPAKLLGTWRSTSFRTEGRNVEMVATWTFANGNLDIRQANGSIGMRYIVDTRSRPKMIEVKILGKAGRILYKLEGDSLIVCYDQGLSMAPKTFGGEGKGRNLIVFERRKER